MNPLRECEVTSDSLVLTPDVGRAGEGLRLLQVEADGLVGVPAFLTSEEAFLVLQASSWPIRQMIRLEAHQILSAGHSIHIVESSEEGLLCHKTVSPPDSSVY
jgi:hypothetical protein